MIILLKISTVLAVLIAVYWKLSTYLKNMEDWEKDSWRELGKEVSKVFSFIIIMFVVTYILCL